nr:myelodysplastic syndrome 2 translocation-associated protein [Macaca nemestrina]
MRLGQQGSGKGEHQADSSKEDLTGDWVVGEFGILGNSFAAFNKRPGPGAETLALLWRHLLVKSCNILNSSPAVRGGAHGRPQLTPERLLRPGYRLHSCSEAEKGGFVRRREQITLFPPCEDPARRWLSASPGREPSPGICWHLNLGLASLHNCKK